jgi:pyrroline-5-carboxylate reductase
MRIAVMGCGNMGRALISGLLENKRSNTAITAFDKIKTAMSFLPKNVTIADPQKWFFGKLFPDAVIIAVKPQDIESACKILSAAAGRNAKKTLWISIAAGISIDKLQLLIGKTARICRVMPNTPALIREGASAYALNDKCAENDSVLVEQILNSCGLSVRVPEKLMDAVTGLSGSGPAYVYLFIEALIEGGVTAGIPLETARKLAVQTVIGSAKMVANGNDSPSQLKARVMSPGGTTVKGLMELEKYGFKYSVIRAIASAGKRASELGKK